MILEETKERLETIRKEIESASLHMESADPAGYAEDLLDMAGDLVVENERMRAALAFYGDMANYHIRSGDLYHSLTESPPGTVARLALAGTYDVMLERYSENLIYELREVSNRLDSEDT